MSVDARRPWQTAADLAELDVLIWEFVGAALEHRQRCVVCRLGAWCDPLRDAFEAVLDWKHGRELKSKAAWLRERQTDSEAVW